MLAYKVISRRCTVTMHRQVSFHTCACWPVWAYGWINQSGKPGECFILSCTLFPSLIRNHSVNQAWIPNTITCKVLCLKVIGLARAVFLRRLASFSSFRPQPGAPSKKRSWLEEDGEMSRKRMKDKWREERLKRGGGRRDWIWIIGSFSNFIQKRLHSSFFFHLALFLFT